MNNIATLQGTKTTSESAAVKQAARLGGDFRVLKIQELFGRKKLVYIPVRQGEHLETWLKHIEDAWYLELVE